MPNETNNDEVLRKVVGGIDWKTIRKLFVKNFEYTDGRTLCNVDSAIIKELLANGAYVHAKDDIGDDGGR